MKKFTLLAVLILSIQTVVTAGGPWPKGKGNAYIKLSVWWTVYDQHYTDQGLLDPNVTTGLFNTALYVEYGISDQLTGIFNGTLLSRNYMNNIRSFTTGETIVAGEGLNSLGDIDLGLKYTLNKGSALPISLSLVLGLPTGKTAGGTQENLQTGDGEFNQLLQVDLGKGFDLGKGSGYFSAYLGVNNRTKGFSEELRYGMEIGVGLINKKLWLSGKLNAVESFKNGETAATSMSSSVFANNTEFLALGLEANVYIKGNIGLSAGFASAVSGQVVAAAPSYTVGVFLDLN